MAEREEMAFLFYMLILGGAMVYAMVKILAPIITLLFLVYIARSNLQRIMAVVIVLALFGVHPILVRRWRDTDLKTKLNSFVAPAASWAGDLLTTRLDRGEELLVCKAGKLHLRSNLIGRDRDLAETMRELLRSNPRLRTCGSPDAQPISGSPRPSAEREETYLGRRWISKGLNAVMLRLSNSHVQNWIPTQKFAVGAWQSGNGRVNPWWTTFVVVLLALSLCIIVVLRSRNTDLKTQFNRSEKQAHNLASDLRTTQLDLAGKLLALNDREVEQDRLRTNLTARDLELAAAKDEKLDRELTATKRELQHSNQHLRMCGEQNEQLNKSVQLLNHSADIAMQREQRQTDLLCASEKKCTELHLTLEKTLRRVGEAEGEGAEGRADEEEFQQPQQQQQHQQQQPQHQQQHQQPQQPQPQQHQQQHQQPQQPQQQHQQPQQQQQQQPQQHQQQHQQHQYQQQQQHQQPQHQQHQHHQHQHQQRQQQQQQQHGNCECEQGVPKVKEKSWNDSAMEHSRPLLTAIGYNAISAFVVKRILGLG